ncbi:MAG: hypothetical protein ACM336_10785 [Acidobacteriota bacterium]|nr:hypothetical protein [Bryobacteraceae bacterium]
MAESRQLMSQAEYARHRGKSRQYISRLAKAGVLVMRGGKVDAAASDAVLDDRPEPVSERITAAPEAAPSVATFAQARTADMVFRAKLRKIEYDVRIGKLIEAELFKQRIEAIGIAIKEAILAWPNRVAPEITPLTDERQVRDVLMREARVLINDLRGAVQYAR